jgi:sugar lactone lactonase YvrE
MYCSNYKSIPVLLCVLLLAACGGGGGSSDPPTSTTNLSGDNTTTPQNPPGGGSTQDPASPSFAYDETARFDRPTAITADAAGNLYVLDSIGKKIRKISPAGDVSTLPFTQLGGNGLEVDAEGNLYTLRGNAIHQIAPDGSSSVLVQLPQGANWMTNDSTGYLHVLVTDSGSNTAGIFAVMLGSGAVTMEYSGSPLDPANSMAIALSGGNRYVGSRGGSIFQIPLSGAPTQFAGGPGSVGDMAFDVTGNLYVSRYILEYPSVGTCQHSGNCDPTVKYNAIDRIMPDGTATTIVEIPVQGSDVMTANNMGIASITVGPDGNVYAAYQKSHAVYKITPTGTMTLFAGKAGEVGNSD